MSRAGYATVAHLILLIIKIKSTLISKITEVFGFINWFDTRVHEFSRFLMRVEFLFRIFKIFNESRLGKKRDPPENMVQRCFLKNFKILGRSYRIPKNIIICVISFKRFTLQFMMFFRIF